MKDIYLAGLDLGTSAVKGVVMDARGTVRAAAEKTTRYHRPRPEWVEADAHGHFADVCDVIRQLAAASPGPIRALAMSAASGNTLLADADGEPLTAIINWMDRRSTKDLPRVVRDLDAAAVREITGWPCVDTFPLAHLAWLRENRPDVFRRAVHVCMNTDWLLFGLTGNWLMDYSTATTSHLQDQVARRHHDPFLRLLEIPESTLSRLVDSGFPAGRLTVAAATATGLPPGTEIVTGCFDHPSAARAVGVLDPGRLMISCGTSWVGFFPEPDRQAIIDAGLLCDPFLAPKGGPWGAMFSVPYIGQTIDAYVRDVIAPGAADPYAVFNAAAAATGPGAGGLEIDLRAPARTIAGSRENISRAVMEGAVRLLHAELRKLEARGIRFESAVMVGGPSRSPLWMRILADITSLRISAGTPHCGAKGAAILAGIGAGVYRDEYDALQKETP